MNKLNEKWVIDLILWVIAFLVCGVIFVNGLNDAPNSITTCVATRSLSPKKALVMAAVFSFLGVVIMSFINTAVAKTVYSIADFGENSSVALIALCAAMIAIVGWSLFAWKMGIPTSQSHALVAGLTGANIAALHGFSGINLEAWKKVLFGLLISTVLGFTLGFLIPKLFERICRYVDRRKTIPIFKRAQVLADAAMCFMDGAQDSQKFLTVFIMGIFLSNGVMNVSSFDIPLWMMFVYSAVMTVGMCIGGPRIIKNVGMRMAKIEPYQGVAADLAEFTCLLFSSLVGIPISTGQTKTTAIMGVSASRRLSSVDWSIAKNMIIAWIVTFPSCGILGYLLTELIVKLF